MAEHECGPEHNADFFNEMNAVFNRHPDAAKTYAIICIDHETDIMGIDFSTQVGLSRIEDGRIIIEYRDRETIPANIICCKWWHESDNTWTCLQRWADEYLPPFPDA